MAKPSIWIHTSREKLGYADGINLFFGALLGANLGTLGAIPLDDYVVLIGMLAGLVMALRAVTLSERRLYAFGMLAFCLAILVAFLFVPTLRPDGLAEADVNRLGATLIIWILVATSVEFYPTRGGGDDQADA